MGGRGGPDVPFILSKIVAKIKSMQVEGQTIVPGPSLSESVALRDRERGCPMLDHVMILTRKWSRVYFLDG